VSDTMNAVFAILRPQGALTEPVIDSLRSMLGERPIDEIGGLPAWKLANEITSRSEAHSFPSDADPVHVAAELRKFMLVAEFIDVQQSKGASLPTSIKLVADERPADMDLEELLKLLASDQSKAGKLLPFIEALDIVKKAERKSRNWVIMNADGTLNVEVTLGYVKQLAKTFSLTRRDIDGIRPIPLGRAFGQEEIALLNPFAFNGKPEERIVTGVFFEMGDVAYDLGTLPEETHLAYIWAAATGRREWPASIDLYEHVPAAFEPELKGRWKIIVEDYRAAVAAHDPTTIGLTRFVTPELLKAAETAATQLSEPEHSDAWYRAQLYAIADNIDVPNSSIRRGPSHVLGNATAGNGSVRLDNVILLGTVTAWNGSTSGTALGSPESSQYCANGSQNLVIRKVSWKALYEEAKRRGLL